MPALLESVIAIALRLPRDEVDDALAYQVHPQWDSANHVALIGALEDAYGLIIADEDIPDLTTVAIIRAYVERHTAG
ncbi:MAG: acyl carrier protein [Gemmatimonas sp.]|jgi:acyl carrier protein|uniref:acyl carrier protein n=1 Tax=Gemmatimonas sp. TaxID=1962908 RepID=UPI00391F1EA7|nr:acyl carrier protein [Gemmatimonadota bacterium]